MGVYLFPCTVVLFHRDGASIATTTVSEESPYLSFYYFVVIALFRCHVYVFICFLLLTWIYCTELLQ